MAMMHTGSWNAQDQNMAATGDDDFQQFFDIGISQMGDAMQFEFQGFHAQNVASMMQQGHRDEVDTPMSDANAASIAAHSNMRLQTHVTPMTSAPTHTVVSPQVIPPQHTPAHTPSDAISKIDAQIQFLQHQRLQQQERQLDEQRRRLQEEQAAFYARQQHQRSLVPPTPQSLEMQAATRYYPSQDRSQAPGSMFDGYQQMKDQQDMAFTPLVSPAVTPLDAHFAAVENPFLVPSAYFSPITSPALHAQPDNNMLFYESMQSGRTSHSPAAMDTESPPAPTGPDSMLKEVRKINTAKRKPKVRQSPITKPQRKKTASTPVVNAQALSELAEVVAEGSSITLPTKSASVSSHEASENASVSPEALEMPPPPLPLPRSARQSPYIAPQQSDEYMPALLAKSLDGKLSPATPASLFRISPRNQAADPGNVEHSAPEHIESFQLPESVNSIDHSAGSQSALSSCPPSDGETPKMAPLQHLPSSATANHGQSVSTTQSPQLNPTSSTPASKRTPVIAPKGGRKRPSVSSSSPALLPKISPHIKPLLPGAVGLSSEDSASLLLASKSNYQRILEGNTMPGVTYPSELSKTLTSKRTSHKIAEQGRRNRINSALIEIAALLPKGSIKEGGSEDGDDKAEAKQSNNTPNSKASTVESAIEYIKQLQKQLADANKRAEEAERKLRETTAKDEILGT
ncbi:hypothetical protein F5Y17DRAFT_422378 [Xylariaceae sp. FL0594]|nr:hypothetical protein F5Y17DRAFT_422378 [Xylariaceae sp. FL0594]